MKEMSENLTSVTPAIKENRIKLGQMGVDLSANKQMVDGIVVQMESFQISAADPVIHPMNSTDTEAE